MKRFWDKVNKIEFCWNWIAGERGNGYGCFKNNKKQHQAHRFSWFLINGRFPKGWLLHKCNNRKCVNPNHLYEGTPKQNYNDMRMSGNAVLPISVKRLNINIIKDIRSEYIPFKNGYKKLAKKYNICNTVIRDIIKGYYWKNI